ncbi:MAG: adventurous gliding motility lipoprotein CglB, partial [Archangium sp.]
EARAAKPNLMLLVDTSGSMTEPVDPSLPACKSGSTVCGTDVPCNTSTCPTRWSSLQAAMNDFLTSSGAIARIGLITYPDLSAGDSCGPSSKLSVPLPPADKDDEATLVANAQAVNNKLQAIKNYSTDSSVQTPRGGTPTSLSLNFAGSNPDLQTTTRADFVLLLTDGVPNCNPNNANAYPSPNCRCTLGSASLCSSSPYDKLGCLDKDGSVTAVQSLKTQEIDTIVIGFGAETGSGDGPDVLNAMAVAGGFSIDRPCKVNTDCGTGDTCNTTAGLCNRRFYQAANKDELVTALRQISEKVQTGNPCLLTFDPTQRPSSEELVVVYLNEVRVSPGADTWNLTADGSLEFTGSTCNRILSSSPTDPVNIEVRAVQRR